MGIQRGVLCESKDCPLGHNHQVATIGVGGVHRKCWVLIPAAIFFGDVKTLSGGGAKLDELIEVVSPVEIQIAFRNLNTNGRD